MGMHVLIRSTGRMQNDEFGVAVRGRYSFIGADTELDVETGEIKRYYPIKCIDNACYVK